MHRILIYILATILFSSSIYAITYYLGMENMAKVLNIVFCLPIWLLLILNVPRYPRIGSRSFYLILFSLIWMIFTGLIQNSITQTAPTIIRYTLYLLSAKYAYTYVLKYGTSAFLHTIKKCLFFLIAVSVFWAIYEIVTGQVEFLNGAYRLSGSFKHHQLAAALFYYVLIILYWEMYVRGKVSLINSFVLLSLIALLYATQSRAFFGIAIIVTLLYIYTGIKSVKVFAGTLCVTLLLMGVAYYIIFFTDALPRIRDSLMTMDNEDVDNSTMTRILIIENSLSNIEGIKMFTGIGVGGFELFYKDITGETEIAAHNNYLLFFVEGGFPAVISYILFQLLFLVSVFKSIRYNKTSISIITFFLFMGITLFSFMLNNYYFYCSELFVWLFLGAFYAERKSLSYSVI